MDISQYVEQDISEHELETPDGTKLGVFFRFAGPAHPATKAITERAWRRGARQHNKRGKAELPDEFEEVWLSQAEDMAARTLGWFDGDGKAIPLEADGKKFEYPRDAVELYCYRRLSWLRLWAKQRLEDGEGFIKRSSPTSSPTPSTAGA